MYLVYKRSHTLPYTKYRRTVCWYGEIRLIVSHIQDYIILDPNTLFSLSHITKIVLGASSDNIQTRLTTILYVPVYYWP